MARKSAIVRGSAMCVMPAWSAVAKKNSRSAWPERVVAFGQKKFLPKQGLKAYDAIQATIEWRDGSVLFVQTSWVCSDHNSALTNQAGEFITFMG